MGPWDPNWRPDPTGRRLIAIRVARRGALASAVIFGGLEVVATVLAWPVAAETRGADLLAGAALALFSLPGLALLGAGLTSAALGSRSSAASAGLAMGVGVPVAAVTSAMIGAFVAGAAWSAGVGADVAGILLRSGVTAAVRISPLIALASVVWVVLVRRFGRSLDAAAEGGDTRRRFSLGRGPRRRGG
jgi:hypothetical protein